MSISPSLFCLLLFLILSVAALSFNSDGSYLAIASSGVFEMGEGDSNGNSIYLHKVVDAEVMPKSK